MFDIMYKNKYDVRGLICATGLNAAFSIDF